MVTNKTFQVRKDNTSKDCVVCIVPKVYDEAPEMCIWVKKYPINSRDCNILVRNVNNASNANPHGTKKLWVTKRK